MSGRAVALPAVEWSPGSVRSFAPGHGLADGVPSGWAGVRAALSRRNTFVRSIRIPNVSGAEADQIIRIQIPQHLPLPPDDLVYAYRLTGDVNAEGRLAVVAAARAGVVRSLYEDMKARGVSVAATVPAAYGSQLLAKALGKTDAAIVESSPEGWSIDLVTEGELRYSRVLPPETDPAALEGEIARTFAMAGVPTSAIVAAGGANLPFAAAQTPKSGLEMLAGAEGGLLGVEMALPEVRAARQRQVVATRARLAILLCVAAVGLGAVVGLDRIEKAERIRKDEGANKKILRKLKNARDGVQTQVSAVGKKAQALDRAFEPAQKASEVIAQVTGLAPKTVWLTGITFERGKPVLVRGVSTQSSTVAAYLESLSTQERFREVKLAFANDALIEDTQVSQFSISLHAIGNLPLADPKGSRRSSSK